MVWIKVAFATLLFLVNFTISPTVDAMPDSLQINEDRIVYWQEKRLGRQLSEYEKQAFLADYLKVLGQDHVKPITPFKPTHKDFHKHQSQFAPRLQAVSDDLSEVKVLAILIDFPDLTSDSPGLSEGDTDMLYEAYNPAHYRSLMFSDSGYAGPNDEALMSAKQYYAKASGDSFKFTGDVYGWVRANNTAATYGKRQGQTRDVDVQSLVIEAVEKAVQQYNIDLSEYDKTDLNDLDGDGNLNEPDGVIDHLMLFHASIGEEAGGGLLAEDAIWSHRFFVVDEQRQPHTISGSTIKAYNYTINPIDAGIGVVVHEFAHDLGLPDEYDLISTDIGEPVANWSVMSSGSWTGKLRGSEPVMFSPKNLEFLQNRFGGNWLKQDELDLSSLMSPKTVQISELGVNNQQTNQIKINLPSYLEDFIVPSAGQFQYYSGEGNNIRTQLGFTINLPQSNALKLSMLAQFNIERDYDVFQVFVNGNPISGNLTKPKHPNYGNVTHYIDGSSQALDKANGEFVLMEYDLTSFANQQVQINFLYQTDVYTNYFGIVIDEINILNNGALLFEDGAEQENIISLNGFRRLGQYKSLKSTEYYLQLRSHQGLDSGLRLAGYSPGVLLWYGNDNFEDNNTSSHPGTGQLLVVDTDQRPIFRSSGDRVSHSTIQVRDAALSLADQSQGLGDDDLSAISTFSDSNDYSFTPQPESGVSLPKYGLNIELTAASSTYEDAEVTLSYIPKSSIEVSIQDKTVLFSVSGLELSELDQFDWQIGNELISRLFSPSHTFTEYKNYPIVFTQTKANGEVVRLTRDLELSKPLTVSDIESSHANGVVNLSLVAQGGTGPYTVAWDFGDGNSGEGLQIEHTYKLSGTYTIRATTTDSAGAKASTSLVLSLAVPMQANAQISQSGKSVTASSTTAGGTGNYTHSWDMGDGTVLQGDNITHNYNSEGSYEVKLTSTDTSTGKTDVFFKTIQVVEPSSGDSGGSVFWLLALLSLTCIRRAVR